LHHGDFFTMIIFAPSPFLLGYTSYVVHYTCLSKIISVKFLWHVSVAPTTGESGGHVTPTFGKGGQAYTCDPPLFPLNPLTPK